MRVNRIEKSFMANNYYNRKNLSYIKDKSKNESEDGAECDLKFENIIESKMKLKTGIKFEIEI